MRAPLLHHRRAAAAGLLGSALLLAGAFPAPVGAAVDPPPSERWVVAAEPGQRAAALASIEAVGARVVHEIGPIDHVVVETSSAAGQALRQRRGVADARPDARLAVAAVTPDDPQYAQQWGLPKIGAPAAWDDTMGDRSVTVAVLDTGVDDGHPDLAGAVLAGTDLVNNDSDAHDDNGHGTAVAGVVAANTDNGVGIAGLCGVCTILPVKVLDESGFGFESDIAEGVTWAADRGAEIINLSIASVDDGSGSSFTALSAAIDYARSKGAIVVAAAGNEGSTLPTYPAASTGVIGVAATDQNDNLYSWSNSGLWVDVAAPGCTLSTVPGGYSSVCGTSFAAPLVSALAALGRTADHATSRDDVEAAITDTATPIGVGVLHGRIRAADALARLSPGVGRAAGNSRMATAIAVAQHAFPTGASTVVVATAQAYADALAAAPLAAVRGGPILLVGSGGVTAEVSAELRRLQAATAVIVGGTGAVPTSVETQLRSAGVSTVERIAGSNRFDTARRIADAIGSTSVFVAEGANPDPNRGWPDAVAVSGLAAHRRHAILLAKRDTLPSETASALVTLGATTATVVGGTASVSDAVANALRDPDGDGTAQVTVSRIAGANRYETSAAVADAAVAAGASLARLWFATGQSWPDALAAGPAVGAQGGVLLLVNGSDFSKSATSSSWLASHSGYRWGRIAGGTAAVSAATEQDIAQQLEGS